MKTILNCPQKGICYQPRPDQTRKNLHNVNEKEHTQTTFVQTGSQSECQLNIRNRILEPITVRTAENFMLGGFVMIEFKKGDKVYSPEYKNGTIADIVPGERNHIKVIFESGETEEFNGKEVDCWLRIYHGQDLAVSVDECLPKRKQYKYLNVSVLHNALSVEFGLDVFDSIIEARESACVVHYGAVDVKVEV